MKNNFIGLSLMLLTTAVWGINNKPNSLTINQNPKVTDGQVRDLSSKNLGFYGPLSVRAQYSEKYGYVLQGQYTKLFSGINALSLVLEYGKNQNRMNGTWGYVLSPHQRIKLTAERLAQKINFDFFSGGKKEWLGQYAYGLSYEYLLPKSLINNINFNMFYSKASSEILSNKVYHDDSDFKWYRNYRHIAGAKNKGVSVGFDILPTRHTLFGAKLNYDKINYNTLYLHGQDTAGFGTTVSLKQLIAKNIKLTLLASNKKPYRNYQIGLAWLLFPKSSHHLELELIGARLLGGGVLSNDAQISLGLSYYWDFSSKGQAKDFSLEAENNFASLTNWVSKPAVYMPEVLAIKDEKRELINDDTQQKNPHKKSLANVITVRPNEEVNVDVKEYFTSKTIANDKFQCDVEGLPQEYLQYKNGRITGKFSRKASGKTYRIKIFIKSNSKDIVPNVQNNIRYLIIEVVKDDWTPKPYEGHYPEDPLVGKVNEKLASKKYYAIWLFYDPEYIHNTLELAVDGLPSDSGVNWNYYHDSRNEANSTLTFSETPTKPGIYKVKIKARTDENPPGSWSPETQNFTLIVQGSLPRVDIPIQHYMYHKGVDIDLTSYINPGQGDKLKEVKAYLSEYGLELKFNRDNQKVTIVGSPAKPILIERSIPITVSNYFGGEVRVNFKLNISGPPIKLSDIGAKTFTIDKSFMPISLANHFAIPAGSGEIDDWDITVKTSEGEIKGGKLVKDLIGFEIKYGQLQGKIKKDAVTYDINEVLITAKNVQGSSVDKNGSPASSNMQVTINPA